MRSGAKYKSSNPSIVKINASTGLVIPRKEGSAKITATYKGVSITFTIRVVSSIEKDEEIEKYYNVLKKAANQVVQAYGEEITSANRYKILNAVRIYEAKRSGNYSDSQDGVEVHYTGSSSTDMTRVHYPVLVHARAISRGIRRYTASLNPIGTRSAKWFKIASISGKGSKITIKLKRKITADQIFGINGAVQFLCKGKKVSKSNVAKFPIYIKRKKKYLATATATKGKDIISINLKTSKLKKLRKGKTYSISGYEEWIEDGYELGFVLDDWVLDRNYDSWKFKAI